MSTTAADFDKSILSPALDWFRQHAPTIPVSRNAHVLMLAIAGQEGDWQFRVQHGNGPAHGFWQFERLGGVVGVMSNKASAQVAHDLCVAAGVEFQSVPIWGLFATVKGDNLATAFARLLLWTDPHAIPAPTDEDGTWAYYVRNWRPGKPHFAGWHARITAANEAVVP